jgi:uncharacterized membrane protein
MRWWLSVGICAVIVACLFVNPVLADTGTYSITSYHVKLEPQDDGNVRITITQDWAVDSGNIPWVTVGLPNSHYRVESQGDNAVKVSADNSNGFDGVRIDLDKTYYPGQTFRVTFTVMQSNLLERLPDQNLWRIAYTPGWYDRTFVDNMQIDLVSPVDAATYTMLTPQPDSTVDNVILWKRDILVPGQHFTVLAESSDGTFLTKPSNTIGGSSFPTNTVILVVVLGAIVMLIIWAATKAHQRKTILIAETEKQLTADPVKKEAAEKGFEKYVEDNNIKPDSQGRYYDRGYGNYITPVIWTAFLMNNNNRRPPTSGTSGGSSSCHCACVSCACACACACAGGGAAGCTKKGFHECKDCSQTAKTTTDKV